jgi:hypothetical protein
MTLASLITSHYFGPGLASIWCMQAFEVLAEHTCADGTDRILELVIAFFLAADALRTYPEKIVAFHPTGIEDCGHLDCCEIR